MAYKIIPDSVRDFLHYDPETGVISWKVNRSRGVKAGDIAGSIKKSTGYREIRLDNRAWLAHRLAWFLAHGEQPDVIDHINHDRADNRLCNLRNVGHQANQLNRTADYRGVYFKRRANGSCTWVAHCGDWSKSCGDSILLAHFHRHMYVTATYHLALPAPPPE